MYVESGSPASAAIGLAHTAGRRRNRPVRALAAATPVAVPLTDRIQLPTLIGELTLNIRSIAMNRSGRPRSAINSGGLALSAASAVSHARRASTSSQRR